MGIVYFTQKPGEKVETTFTIPDVQTTFTPSSIVRIDIEAEHMRIRLERVRIGWRITEPVSYNVENTAINNLLEALNRFRLSGLVSTNPQKQNLYGVGEEGTLLTLTHEDGKRFSIVVGKYDSVANQTFVRFPMSDSVYLADGIQLVFLSKDLRYWREKVIVALNPDEIKSISLRRGTESANIQRKDNRWLTEGRTIPDDIINSVLRLLSPLYTEDFVDTMMIITEPPRFQLEIQEKKQIRMDIFRVSGTGAKVYLKTNLSPSIFVVDAQIQQPIARLADYAFVAPEPEIEKPLVEPSPTQPVRTPPLREAPSTTPPKTPPVVTTPPQRATPPVYTPRLEEEGELVIYTVQKGETLESIAKKFGVTVDDIKKWNQLRTATVKPGTDLYLFTLKKR